MILENENTLPEWLIDRLPKYDKIDSIPQAYSDSTHQLWRLQGSSLDGKNHFLKVCNHTESPFWQIMQSLFDFNLRSEIANSSDTYALLDTTVSLEIPELIKAEKIENNNAYILTLELDGTAANRNNNDKNVQRLANHLAELHSNPKNSWGSLNKPKFQELDWPKRLESALVESDKKWGGVLLNSDKYLSQAVEACSFIQATSFVPMMPDLRWDQFLQDDDEISALVDLDAFVFAPSELDFVILEYILTPEQVRAFSHLYSKYHVIPDITKIRPAYRLLLFYMQILGETDLDDWMNKETLF